MVSYLTCACSLSTWSVLVLTVERYAVIAPVLVTSVVVVLGTKLSPELTGCLADWDSVKFWLTWSDKAACWAKRVWFSSGVNGGNPCLLLASGPGLFWLNWSSSNCAAEACAEYASLLCVGKLPPYLVTDPPPLVVVVVVLSVTSTRWIVVLLAVGTVLMVVGRPDNSRLVSASSANCWAVGLGGWGNRWLAAIDPALIILPKLALVAGVPFSSIS